MPRHCTHVIRGVTAAYGTAGAVGHAARAFRRCWWAQTGLMSDIAAPAAAHTQSGASGEI
eukprot:scaffold15776_cov75-Phaeocystis_antarctica.AAC.5